MPKNSSKNIRFTITDDSHKELFSASTTRGRVKTWVALAIVAVIFITYAILAWTPARNLIPGYPNAASKKAAVENKMRMDSLEREMAVWNMQLTNIKHIVKGEEPILHDSIMTARKESEKVDEKNVKAYADGDSALRAEVRKQEKISAAYQKTQITQIEGMHFFTPVQGLVTAGFNRAIKHNGIDIAAPEGAIVYAVLDGTVISAGWNDDTGFTIQIQHANNLISIYKHAEKLLKDTGDKVSAGTPIALVGSTGKLSTGDHLHFELWHDGEPVDPALYINF
jgi:murein DD-endopeptidase MepM/ murein hydrolase activator NlpD